MTDSRPGPAEVQYGRASLSDLLPSVLAALGVPGEVDVLPMRTAECIVVLLVDGLGWQLLNEHPADAPFLAGLTGRALTAGFPTTTAVSITSLGTGTPAGAHGITGYTTRADGLTEPANWLTWNGAYSGRELLEEFPPEQVQPVATAFERAVRAGVNATVVSAPAFQNSGLTRAALRGAEYRPSFTAADTAAQVATAARERGGLIYCYVSDLDLIGHVRGCRSQAWAAQLALIDRGAELLATRLPSHARLLVTADHGMLDVGDHAKVDYDDEPLLSEGVDLIAGEARLRYLHVAPDRLADVRTRWTDVLGDRVTMLTRDEAVERGWFGAQVSTAARGRIGDLLALATGDLAVVRRRAESRSAALIGHHGALSEAELLVPLLST